VNILQDFKKLAKRN